MLIMVINNNSNIGYVIKGEKKTSIRSLINDDEYLNNDFIKTVQLRGAAIIEVY
jgi:hypothetical protein